MSCAACAQEDPGGVMPRSHLSLYYLGDTSKRIVLISEQPLAHVLCDECAQFILGQLRPTLARLVPKPTRPTACWYCGCLDDLLGMFKIEYRLDGFLPRRLVATSRVCMDCFETVRRLVSQRIAEFTAPAPAHGEKRTQAYAIAKVLSVADQLQLPYCGADLSREAATTGKAPPSEGSLDPTEALKSHPKS